MSRIRIDIPSSNLMAAISIKVRITDINYGNHIGNDSFVAILHEARMQWLRQHNFTELDIDGVGLTMSDLGIEFKNEGFYGEEIEVKLYAGELSKVSFDLYYELKTIRKDLPVLLAKAKTGMVCYNYSLKKVSAVPGSLKSLLTND